jgi:hypothetical protein
VNTAVGDASNDPKAATIERGRVLLQTIVDRVAVKASSLLEETTEGTNS